MLRKTNKKSSFALFLLTFYFYFDIIEKIRKRGSDYGCFKYKSHKQTSYFD